MDDITYYVPCRSELKDWIKKVISYKLFHTDWMLLECMLGALTTRKDKAYNGRPYYIMAVALHNGIPVGVCFIRRRWMNVYVKPKHRRKGLATNMLDLLDQDYGVREGLLVEKGSASSIPFYKSLNLKI